MANLVPPPQLRTDGLYMSPTDDGYKCLRFYADGRVTSASVVAKERAYELAPIVAKWLAYERKDASNGRYTIKGNRLEFRIKVPEQSGNISYTGALQFRDYLELDIDSSITGYRTRSSYWFVLARFKH